jgi:hypothetical protein
VGRPASPFINQGEGAGYTRERGKSQEEEGPGATPSFFSYRRVLLVLQMITGAIGGRRQPVIAFHPVLTHGMVNRLPSYED